MIVGIVGDIHLPFEHPHYLEFVQDTFESYNTNCLVLIGDVVDHHALGFWENDPDGFSASEEADKAYDKLETWYSAIGKARVCIGNHDSRHQRVAAKAGLPTRYLRSYAQMFGTPKWRWDFSHEIEGVLYEHGTSNSGKFAAFNRALEKRQSTVIGHCHYGGGVLYHTSDKDRIFGMQVGCGVDVSQYAFAYGKDLPRRPTLGCGIVIDGNRAIWEPMPLSKGEPYYKRRKRNASVVKKTKRSG